MSVFVALIQSVMQRQVSLRAVLPFYARRDSIERISYGNVAGWLAGWVAG